MSINNIDFNLNYKKPYDKLDHIVVPNQVQYYASFVKQISSLKYSSSDADRNAIVNEMLSMDFITKQIDNKLVFNQSPVDLPNFKDDYSKLQSRFIQFLHNYGFIIFDGTIQISTNRPDCEQYKLGFPATFTGNYVIINILDLSNIRSCLEINTTDIEYNPIDNAANYNLTNPYIRKFFNEAFITKNGKTFTLNHPIHALLRVGWTLDDYRNIQNSYIIDNIRKLFIKYIYYYYATEKQMLIECYNQDFVRFKFSSSYDLFAEIYKL